MVDYGFGPRDPVREVVQREATRWYWLPLVTGVAWFIIGWAVLRADVTSLKTVGILVGFVFLGVAVTEAALAWLFHGGWRVMHAVVSVLFLLSAGWAFVRPVNTFFALASVLGLLLLLQGVSSITQAIGLRDISPYWGFALFSGLLMTALGLWVSTSDRVWTLAARSAFVLLWVGFMAVFRGIQDVTTGFVMLRLGKEETQPSQPAGAGGPAAVPAQRESTSRSQTSVQTTGRPAG
jgi:uncharacterized membrane protein HdeD (DUF308 family)